ncbi:hypothetical protein AXG93_1024s1070 [Marchantia polymorpha subsp. ruderalis]|uniref:RING-type E3 ubiquitin transferase n=1 Tax=Marchantia polymorpha subsp. ruderalis TaxID=1480154 RepID=A0A176VN12_MARPO|nr:hypothetical protein AXG93_1024s1070 [Marchantia polymorpha subsp. ruderalis]
MADPQQQTPQIEYGGQPGSTEDASREARGGQDNQEQTQGAGETISAGHWCHQCQKEVIAEAEVDGGTDSMVCSECRSGFIEALATAQTLPDVRRAQRRRRRRATATAAIIAGASPGGATARQMVPLSEALEHLYPQQLLQVLQLLGQATNRSNNAPPASLDEENHTTVQAHELVEGQTPAVPEDGELPNLSGFLSSIHTSREEAGGGQEGRTETPTDGEELGTLPAAAQLALDRITQDGHLMFIQDTSPSHDDDDADEELVVSDTETEEGMVFDAWDSAEEDDDEEWEEVDEDEEPVETGVEDGAGEDNEAESQEGEQPLEQNGEGRQPRVREFRLRTRNMEHNLHQYLQELLQTLVGQNIEVRVELPDGPLYVGNPGDYVDARGFEMLLQQMAENDNSRRGAPPASKTAVECLPSISIEQAHVDDGSAVCAICKDVVALGEPAKQLPCLHLYHNDCILPWLSSRNSCPVCRYELPTDDPDYEEQKQSRRGTVQNNSASQSPSSLTQVAEDGLQGNNSGGDQVSDSSSHQSNVRETTIDAVEPIGTSNPRNGVEQVASGEGERGHEESAPELSFSQGSDTINTNTPLSRDEVGERERGENESDEVDRGETMRGTGRGWFLLAAGPVLSMMGLVLVLCIGNHLIGGRMQHLGRPLHRQQHHFFQEPHIEQIGGGSEVQGRRRWWMPFQR